MERLILDIGAPIALERGQAHAADALPADADVAISAITAAELLVGVELADGRHRAGRQSIVEGIVSRVEIVAYDLDVARHHASLLARARSEGEPRGAPRPSDRRDSTCHRPHPHHNRHHRVH